MGYFLIGIIVLSLGLLLIKQITSASVMDLAKMIRQWGGALVLLLAAFMAVTGRWILAIPIAGFGYSMLRGQIPGIGSFSRPRSQGQSSRVTSRYLEMTLDHDTGEMTGRILDGQFQNAELQSLSLGDLQTFMSEVSGDEESEALLGAYMDWRFAGWRDEEGAAGAGSGRGRTKLQSVMNRGEALAILGLGEDASASQIRKAHRNLMKMLHPDQGGSTYFASKLNEARDFLLS